jgi:phage tail-like protein
MAATARSQSTDFFSMNKFQVLDTQGILNLNTPAAGFNTCTSPEMTLGVAEYQEGIEAYRRKYPGEPTFAPITMTKGIVKTDTTFYQWVIAGAQNQPYRTNLIINHYHRDDVSGLVNYAGATPTRVIRLFNAFATRVKMGSDFDSTAADVSIEDLDVEYEYFGLYVNGKLVASTTPGSQ